METEPLERTAYEPDIYANNGIQPIPEKIQAEIRATLAQAKAKKSIQNSVSNKKPAKSEPIELIEYKLQSAPCATQEKARAEVEAKLREVIAERLKQYNLTDESSIDSILTSLKPKTVIQESTKEVAGEKYPIYTGTIEIALGREFDRNMVRHFNSLSARNRYEWLMAGSVLAVIVLAMIDRLVLSSSKPATMA